MPNKKSIDQDNAIGCASCGEPGCPFTCATCMRDVCDGCARENEHGEVVCPEHAP